jgi:Domain of unknown function (DUF4160)
MPEVFRVNGIKFPFFSNESNPREPIHIHAKRSRDEAKSGLGLECLALMGADSRRKSRRCWCEPNRGGHPRIDRKDME